ncbi:hypothetical protein [Shimia sp. MIT1388]|uniref:SEL1-like repeat protein n=1 Tax=Shimia sp. MIT1388 TaxID=3096992 RepID=UPI00399A99B1
MQYSFRAAALLALGLATQASLGHAQQALTFKPVTEAPAPDTSETPAPLTPMRDIEAAWAQKNYAFVRAQLLRHVEETDQPLAQYRYGRVLLEAIGGPRDLEGAAFWLEKAASQKYAPAENLLARLYLSAPKDSGLHKPERAVKLFASAAARGVAESQYYMGIIHRDGIAVEPDAEVAFNWLLAAAEQNHEKAQLAVSRAYARGGGVAQNADSAVQWLTQAAENGHVQAQFNLARAYDEGRGVEQDRARSLKWLTSAAEAGHLLSQRALGRRYLTGDDVAADSAAAMTWLSTAAKRGDVVAMTLLGDAFGGDYGIAKDAENAWAWYSKASDAEYGRATSAVADMLARGDGRPVDMAAAVKTYRKALEQGYAPAQIALGQLAGQGKLDGMIAPHIAVPWAVAAATEGDVAAREWLQIQAEADIRPAQTAWAIWLVEQERKPDVALPFLTKAAQAGDTEAQFRLGQMLTRGEGGEQDYIQAHAWLNIAATGGRAEAADLRTTVTELMTLEEVAEAQTIARDFFEQAASQLPKGVSQ